MSNNPNTPVQDDTQASEEDEVQSRGADTEETTEDESFYSLAYSAFLDTNNVHMNPYIR